MDIKQVAAFVNNATKEMTGEIPLVNDDLKNIVDVGNTIFGSYAMDSIEISGLKNNMLNQIGKMIFVDRKYNGAFGDMVRESWEYGSILAKVQTEMPEAEDNDSWKLVDGASYDEDQFYGAEATVKYYNSTRAFEIGRSITDVQLKQAFTSADQMMRFYVMLEIAVANSFDIKREALCRATLNNFIAETIYTEFSNAAYSTKTGTRAINLLYLYNEGPNKGQTALTTANMLHDEGFLRFAGEQINLISNRIKESTRIFNIEGKTRFTPKEFQRLYLHNDFATATKFYLYNGKGQLLNDEIKLPDGEAVSFWQGPGKSYAPADSMKIKVTTKSGHVVDSPMVIGCLIDRDGCIIGNETRTVTSKYNNRGQFTSYWHKFNCGFLNDFSENFIVFFAA